MKSKIYNLFSIGFVDFVVNKNCFLEHKEFIKKRKDHYKNEFNPAVLLKQKLPDEDDEEEEGEE